MIERAILFGVGLSLFLAACQRSSSPSKGADGGNELRPALWSDPTATADPNIRQTQERARSSPKNAAAWESLGWAWAKKARNDQDPNLFLRAEDAIDHALELSPESRSAREAKITVLIENHKFRQAQTLARAMVEKNRGDAAAWTLLGDAELELGNYHGAEEAYQRMLEGPRGLAAWSRVAYLRWLRGDIVGSLEGWTQAIQKWSGDRESLAFCLSEVGHVEWHRGKLDAALASYDKALEVMPGHAGALFGRGRVQFARGQYAAALADFQSAERARSLLEIRIWLGAAQRALGQIEAADVTELGIEREGKRTDPRTLSLFYSTRKRNLEQAVDLAQTDGKERDDIYTKDALGFALVRAGKLALARPLIEAAISLGTPDARLLAHAGLLDALQGRREQARKRLKAALALNPRFDPVLADEAKKIAKDLDRQH